MQSKSKNWKWKIAVVLVLSVVFPALAFSNIQSGDRASSPKNPKQEQRHPFSRISVTGFAFSQPARQLRDTVDHVLAVLADPGLQQETRLRRIILRQLIADRLDVRRMAQSTLQPFWKQATPKQRQRFVGLFEKLLDRSYLSLVETYTRGTLHYTGEIVRANRALVRTRVIMPSRMLEIDYRLIRKRDEWRVYDVALDGVSLAANYREQFHSILKHTSIEGLLRRMEKQLG